MTEDEKFFAWLDGELGPAEAAEMEAKIAVDPQLARLAEQHRALRSQLKGAFDPIATVAVPDHLPAAMAATLAIGVLVGTMVPQRTAAPVEMQGGNLYAAAALDHALDTQLASAPAGGVRIGLTFRDQAGEVCRSFTQSASSGLACRN